MLFELKKTERLWHIPLLSSFCVGFPLFIGYYFDRLDYGIVSSMAGLVFLYLPVTTEANQMITLLVCSFGFMISVVIGLFFSFNPILSAVVLGLYAMNLYRVVNYFGIKPLGTFFFILIASVAS